MSALFANVPVQVLQTILLCHSDKNCAAINNYYLDFLQMPGLNSLVNDNHIANNLKEILVYVNLGSIVNNRPKNYWMSGKQCKLWTDANQSLGIWSGLHCLLKPVQLKSKVNVLSKDSASEQWRSWSGYKIWAYVTCRSDVDFYFFIWAM